MATHSSLLAWRIPWTEEPGGLQSMGLQRVRHDSSGTGWPRGHFGLPPLGGATLSVGRCLRCGQTYNAQDSPPTRNHPARNVSCAELEES